MSTSRAVLRAIEPSRGEPEVYCEGCGLRISFKARVRANRVICNVYVGGQWQRIEQFHEDCYQGAHGPPASAPKLKTG